MILFLWVLLTLIGIKYQKVPKQKVLTKENTLVLKGICAIEIMIGHIGLATGEKILFANRKAGILFVGIFMLISGYGLMYNWVNKKDYLKGFLKRRVTKIVITAYIIYAIGTLLLQRPVTNFINLKEFFLETNWYVWEIVGLYVVFLICAKLFKPKMLCIVIFSISVLFVVTAFVFKIDNPWYGSTLCFPLGIYFYINENIIFEKYVITPRYKGCIILLSGILCITIALFFALGEDSIIGNMISRNISAMSFTILVVFILCHFDIGNRMSVWLGNISYEIFLFHPIYIKLFENMENNLLFAGSVTVATIVSAYIYKICERKAIYHSRKELV